MSERTTIIRASGDKALEDVREELDSIDFDEGSVHRVSVDIEEREVEEETTEEVSAEATDSEDEVELRDAGREYSYGDNLVRSVLTGVKEYDGRASTKDLDSPSASGVLSWLFENDFVERESQTTGGGWEYVYEVSDRGEQWLSQNQ